MSRLFFEAVVMHCTGRLRVPIPVSMLVVAEIAGLTLSRVNQPHVNPTIPTWGTDDDGRKPYELSGATLKGSGCEFPPARS